jgi:hypothetical protein
VKLEFAAAALQARHASDLIDEFHGESVTIATDSNSTPILITDPADPTGFVIQMPCAAPSPSTAGTTT